MIIPLPHEESMVGKCKTISKYKPLFFMLLSKAEYPKTSREQSEKNKIEENNSVWTMHRLSGNNLVGIHLFTVGGRSS